MIPRRALVVLAIASGLVAGAVYEYANRREDVVVAARDIDAPRVLTAEDLETRSVSAGLAPADALRRPEDVVGLVPRAPLLRGQLVLRRGVSEGLPDFSSGLAIPRGHRAVAIPVAAVNAIGGAVAPGAHVDVLAVPVLGRAPAGRTTELLLASAIVLDVRGESGTPLVSREARTALATDRIASVVVAIQPSDETRVADRIATSTFILVLSGVK